jgi:hypothetical protein
MDRFDARLVTTQFLDLAQRSGAPQWRRPMIFAGHQPLDIRLEKQDHEIWIRKVGE